MLYMTGLLPLFILPFRFGLYPCSTQQLLDVIPRRGQPAVDTHTHTCMCARARTHTDNPLSQMRSKCVSQLVRVNKRKDTLIQNRAQCHMQTGRLLGVEGHRKHRSDVQPPFVSPVPGHLWVKDQFLFRSMDTPKCLQANSQDSLPHLD